MRTASNVEIHAILLSNSRTNHPILNRSRAYKCRWTHGAKISDTQADGGFAFATDSAEEKPMQLCDKTDIQQNGK
jgi:hypothetical protein